MKFKKLLAIFLALVIAATVAFALVACDKKSPEEAAHEEEEPEIVDWIEQQDPDDGVNHNKAIIYVTALFGGGLYNDKTNEAVWDPFRADYDLYDHWAPSENTIYKFAEILLEYAKEMDSAGHTPL